MPYSNKSIYIRRKRKRGPERSGPAVCSAEALIDVRPGSGCIIMMMAMPPRHAATATATAATSRQQQRPQRDRNSSLNLAFTSCPLLKIRATLSRPGCSLKAPPSVPFIISLLVALPQPRRRRRSVLPAGTPSSIHHCSCGDHMLFLFLCQLRVHIVFISLCLCIISQTRGLLVDFLELHPLLS